MFRHVSAVVAVLGLAALGNATTVTLDFKGFPDTTILTTQYPGVTFSNAIILTAGISLNEFEFPPHSGVNVVSDNGGPMFIMFSTPVASFGGYFTYAEMLTIHAYGNSNKLLASTMSPFSNNEALAGDPGSSPNEYLLVSSAAGISDVTITGDPLGGSFVLDDATYVTPQISTPEPSYLPMLGLLFALWGGTVSLRRRSRQLAS